MVDFSLARRGRWPGFRAASIATCLLVFGSAASAQTLPPAERQAVAGLKDDLTRIEGEIDQAVEDGAKYGGGLIKALIDVRLEVLRTNAALVEQRIHTLEGGARQEVVAKVTNPDRAMADELAVEIAAQQKKVADARLEADRYSGGLVKAVSESTVATASATLAMLEQQYYIAKYGLLLPAATAQTPEVASGAARPGRSPAAGCLKIGTFDSSVLSSNEVFTELAWKVDVVNSCAEGFGVRVNFALYDKDEFQLDSDSEEVFVPAKGVGKARGKMLVSPPEKARRIAAQGASLQLAR